MEAEDHHLMDTTVEEIMDDSVEGIRGWLCTVLLARGEINAAREESIVDRGNLFPILPRLTAGQQQALLDWRRVKLHTALS